MLFEWDERKRRANLKIHKLDFRDAPEVFDGPTVTYEVIASTLRTALRDIGGLLQRHSRFHYPYRNTRQNPYYFLQKGDQK